jgi:hypothetical protein
VVARVTLKANLGVATLDFDQSGLWWLHELIHGLPHSLRSLIAKKCRTQYDHVKNSASSTAVDGFLLATQSDVAVNLYADNVATVL